MQRNCPTVRACGFDLPTPHPMKHCDPATDSPWHQVPAFFAVKFPLTSPRSSLLSGVVFLPAVLISCPPMFFSDGVIFRLHIRVCTL